MVFCFSLLKYSLFPQFDTNSVYIRGAYDVNYTIKDVVKNIDEIHQILAEKKEELSINKFVSSAGYRLDSQGIGEMNENVFDITLELHSMKPQNFIEKYITPYLSFYTDNSQKIRALSAQEVMAILKEEIEPIKERTSMKELAIQSDEAGIVQHDIEIQFTGSDEEQIRAKMALLKERLKATKGVIYADDNLKFGILELKLNINAYGESLGITEQHLGLSLTPYFSNNEFAQTLGKNGIVSLYSKSPEKDSLDNLKNFIIPVPSTSQFIALKEVVSFVRGE